MAVSVAVCALAVALCVLCALFIVKLDGTELSRGQKIGCIVGIGIFGIIIVGQSILQLCRSRIYKVLPTQISLSKLVHR